MKKGTKALVALLLGCGLVLGGCTNKGNTEPSGGDTPGGETTQYTVAISNKTALQAEWPANGGGRKVELTVEPKANIAQLINNGTIKLKSSDTSVLTITGQMAMPVAAGNATITVESGESSDSVAVVIDEALTIKVKYGVDHEGTEDDPLTNEEAISIAKNDLYNEDGGHEDLHVRGIVERFYQAPGSRADGQVSFYLEPAQDGGEQFEIFKCFKKGTGEASYLTYQDVWVGADVLVHGRFTVYQGTQAETESATFVRSWGEPPVDPVDIQSTFAEALTVGKALADGADSYDYYIFDAYVTKNSGTNYFLTATQGEEITDEKANTIEIYKAEAAGLADKLLKNAKITVRMVLKNYHGQVENGPALAAADVTVLEPGSAWVVPEHNVTVAQGLEVINGLNDGQTTDDLYVFTEVYVTEVKYTWTEANGVTFSIGDTADATSTIYVYKAKVDQATGSKVVAGAQVTLKGNLQKYVKNEAMTPELLNVTSITVKGGDIPVEINYGTLESPLNIAEVRTELDKLGAGVTSEEHFFVKGFVSENPAISTETRGNLWLTNDDGSVEKDFEIYACYGDKAYAANELVGKEIIVEGYGKIYNGTYELTSVKLADNTYDNPIIKAVTENTREAESLVFSVEGGFELKQGAEKAVTAGIRPFPVKGTVEYAVSPADKGVIYEDGKLKATAEAEEGEYTLVASLAETEISENLAFTVVADEGGGGESQTLNATLAKGTGSCYDDITVNSNFAVKVGSSNNTGTATITLAQAGATSVSFYCGAWKGDTVTVNVTTSAGTVSPVSITPTNDDAFTGTLSGNVNTSNSEETYLVTLELTGATAGTVITLTGSKASKCRFFVWNPTYTVPAA